jgi:hypothetical protein
MAQNQTREVRWREPASYRNSGTVDSIAGRKELVGVDGLLDSEHRFAKGKLWDDEQLTATSPMHLVRPEVEQGELAAVALGFELGEIRKNVTEASRARIKELGDEKGHAGLI